MTTEAERTLHVDMDAIKAWVDEQRNTLEEGEVAKLAKSMGRRAWDLCPTIYVWQGPHKVNHFRFLGALPPDEVLQEWSVAYARMYLLMNGNASRLGPHSEWLLDTFPYTDGDQQLFSRLHTCLETLAPWTHPTRHDRHGTFWLDIRGGHRLWVQEGMPVFDGYRMVYGHDHADRSSEETFEDVCVQLAFHRVTERVLREMMIKGGEGL